MLLSLVSDSIFWAGLSDGRQPGLPALIADRKQEGCVRFSFLPAKAQDAAPLRVRRAGDRRSAAVLLRAALRAARLHEAAASTADVVRRGADDGGEMGAFHFVLAPQRESDLQVRMQEYLPVGLEFGIIYQN